mmetsp:Transcript_3845/g.8647  ORF Transcript_3845/g.8647 Transcript_3845/m.8647 type:complete len:121 (+) Transcript_3845:129-491(+)
MRASKSSIGASAALDGGGGGGDFDGGGGGGGCRVGVSTSPVVLSAERGVVLRGALGMPPTPPIPAGDWPPAPAPALLSALFALRGALGIPPTPPIPANPPIFGGAFFFVLVFAFAPFVSA